MIYNVTIFTKTMDKQSVKETTIEFEDYDILCKLDNNKITIMCEHRVSKNKYIFKKDENDIMELTKKSKIELDSQQFYNLIVDALSDPDDTDNAIDTKIEPHDNYLIVNIIWHICENLKREFYLAFDKVPISDTDRMAKIFSEFLVQKDDIYNDHNLLIKRVNEVESKRGNNLVNVTVYTDNVRKEITTSKDIVIKMTVDKKLYNSILLITGTLCVHGEANAELPQIWTLKGPIRTTVGIGQTENYNKNDGYGRPVPCMCVIANHTDVGVQELTLKFNSHSSAQGFKFINPNKLDHHSYGEYQTTSVVKVEEIIQ